jgi:hypothetical protein
MNYEEYSVQQYITVFWKFNEKKNNFIDGLKNNIAKINLIDINDIENIEKNEEYFKIIYDYELFISKIKSLRECLDELLQNSVFNKFEKYNDDFHMKIAYILNELEKKSEVKFSVDKFKNFMYNNTAEGRVIVQNLKAIELLKEIKMTEDYIKNIRAKIIKLKTTKQINYLSATKESDDENNSESSDDFIELNQNIDDNDSTGSLSD